MPKRGIQPGAPTRYQVDGNSEAMTPTRVNVEVRAADGSLHTVSRTLYRSRFGPLVNLGTMSPALAWNAQQAFALRDINTDNFRVFENFRAWNQAASLDDFIAIQKKNAAVPWVNTLAIGRDDPRVSTVRAATATGATSPARYSIMRCRSRRCRRCCGATMSAISTTVTGSATRPHR
ncbi:penicillin acylase family protein [Paraburkholderia tuberum]|uniref:penicillin acylase family protein n=1 Tax=Paraburkholderia tuberum TaxID=157910 RepID=UPI000A5CEC3B